MAAQFPARESSKDSILFRPMVVTPIALGLLVASRLAPELVTEPPLRLALAMLALPGVIYLAAAYTIWIGQSDELQQRIALEAHAVAMAAGLGMTFVLNALQKAGFLTTVDWIDFVGAAFFAGGLTGLIIARRRHL